MSIDWNWDMKVAMLFETAQEALDFGPGVTKGGWYFLEEATGRCHWFQGWTRTPILQHVRGNGLCATWPEIKAAAGVEKCKGDTADWVKKLGQWHLNRPGEYQTICGSQMLGNDYTKVIPENEREKCPKCWGLGEERL